MKYFLIPFLLLLSTISLFSETQITQINPTTVTKPTTIITLLENPLSPSSLRAKFVVVVEEDVKNSSNKIIIPRYTRIICQQNEIKRLEKVDALFASCKQMFLANGKTINFIGNVFDKSQKGSITTEKNKSILKGTKLIVKLE